MTTYARYKQHNGIAPTKDNPYEGMQAFLMSAEVQGWADDAAHKVALAAKEFTPRSDGPGPHLADQFEVEKIPPVILEGNPRRASQVINYSRYAAPVEFGDKKHPWGHRMLARAAVLYGEFHPGRKKAK